MFSKSSLFAIVALAASVSASCLHGTSYQRRQEGTVQVSDFSYTGETGPLNWAGLSPDNSACSTSSVQSPIVIDNTIPFATEVPQIVIEPVAEAEFENLGTTLETIVTGTTTFGGANFTLQQFHLHTPSEHRILDEYFPLEMHMVHEGANGQLVVIAVPFQLTEDGSTTQLLTAVTENLADVAVPGTATKTGALDFTELITAIQTTKLFQYTGSLTTPPCAEGLVFLVVSEPLPLDVKTFNALKSVIKFNARYSQNSLGQTNLLQVAVNLAVSQGAVAPGGGAAAGNNTAVDSNGNTVDVQALVQELVAQNQNLKIETVTTTVTNVVVGSADGNAGAEGDAGAKPENGAEKPADKGAEKPGEKGAEKGAQKGAEKPAPEPTAAVHHAQSTPESEADKTHRVKIERSRIARRVTMGKRRL